MAKNNSKESRKIRTEKKTIGTMIKIYCRSNHKTKTGLCDECLSLHEYAFQRLLHCPFQEDKPVCSDCEVHCYNSRMREKIKKIMQFSGPKMIFRHPYLAIMHILNKK